MSTRKNIFLVIFPFLLGIMLLLWADYLYGQHVASLARKGQWIETKISKATYMQEVQDSFDVVFVGSSRTQNHINTQWLREKGIDCFNLGVSAQQLFNSVYLVEQAAQSAKKYVVLNVTIHELFSKSVKTARHPTWSDLKVFLKFPSTIRGIKVKRILNLFHLYQFQNLLAMYKCKAEVETLRNELNEFYDYDKLNDPRAIYYINKNNVLPPTVKRPMYVVTYTNGDGQIHGSIVNPDLPIKTIDYSDALPKKSTIDYVNMLAKIVKTESSGATLVLNLILATAAQQNSINLEKIQSVFPDAIVVESQCAVESKYWADSAHLNAIGSRIYCEMLLSHLTKLFGQNPQN